MFPVLLAMLQQLNGAPAPTPAPDAPAPVVARAYSGRSRDLSARAPRLSEAVTIDGTLSEPVWQQAALLTEFTSYSPVDGRPAQDNTQVRIWYAPDALYVGIRAWAPPGTVRATLAERDRISNDDWVALHLDTFLDRRRSFVFAVNAFGVQADGMRSDVSAGPGVSRASLQAVDLSQDYVWQSKGQLLDDGFTVELRIPFKSIRYQMAGTQDWGVQVVRQTQRTGYQDTWAPTSRAMQAFTPQSGFLRGLTGLKRGLVFDLTPTSVTSTTGTPVAGTSSADAWRYGTRGEFGGDVRWGITSNFTVNATANPDFSQVETDVGQIPGDVRFALFFLAEYSHMITSSAFFALLFLGGYHLPFVPWLQPEDASFVGVLLKFGVFFGKVVLLICFMMVIRWTIPRMRYDQIMMMGWQGLIPVSLFVVVVQSVMVYMGWTGTLPLLAANLAMAVVILAVIPLLPKSDPNQRTALYGSRFAPMPGERVSTAPTDPMAREDRPAESLAGSTVAR